MGGLVAACKGLRETCWRQLGFDRPHPIGTQKMFYLQYAIPGCLATLVLESCISSNLPGARQSKLLSMTPHQAAGTAMGAVAYTLCMLNCLYEIWAPRDSNPTQDISHPTPRVYSHVVYIRSNAHTCLQTAAMGEGRTS
jgi:hypothetical protein